jgi:hypothetical protein
MQIRDGNKFGSGMEKIQIRDSGSGIVLLAKNLNLTCRAIKEADFELTWSFW